MEPYYINKKINSEQLTIDIPLSMINKEVDIFIIPKRDKSKKNDINPLDFEGKFAHLDIDDFQKQVQDAKEEWERNT